MRTTKVTESLGLTINLGNYESARADVTVEIEATGADDDSMLAMGNQARYQVRKELWESIQPFIGSWNFKRKLELAQRLGINTEDLIEEDEADFVAKDAARRKLGL